MICKQIYTLVMTAANADIGLFQNPTPYGSYLSLNRAKARFEELIAKEKENQTDRYDTEERDETVWEMYEDGYAAGYFVRIEIMESEMMDWSMKNEQD